MIDKAKKLAEIFNKEELPRLLIFREELRKK